MSYQPAYKVNQVGLGAGFADIKRMNAVQRKYFCASQDFRRTNERYDEALAALDMDAPTEVLAEQSAAIDFGLGWTASLEQLQAAERELIEWGLAEGLGLAAKYAAEEGAGLKLLSSMTYERIANASAEIKNRMLKILMEIDVQVLG